MAAKKKEDWTSKTFKEFILKAGGFAPTPADVDRVLRSKWFRNKIKNRPKHIN